MKFAIKCTGLCYTHPWIEICINRNYVTAESIIISDIRYIAVYLQINLESYEWGLSARSVDLKCMRESHSYRKIATRGKQNMLYLKFVAIFRSKHYRNKSVRDDLFILLFLYHNFLICFLSKWIRACDFAQVRVLK